MAKRQLPNNLLSQLPPPPRGYERVIVDNDVLLVNIATQIVHDVLTGVLR
ncbi:MAG: RcnB family protein [Hyphomicrobiaceae bacterium]|nr:RcnB family protein [Hyphomicrobiaceae bacterium]